VAVCFRNNGNFVFIITYRSASKIPGQYIENVSALEKAANPKKKLLGTSSSTKEI